MIISSGAGTVVSCLTTITSHYGDTFITLLLLLYYEYCYYIGEGDEKGKIMGIFRSLGALSRALGPFVACASQY